MEKMEKTTLIDIQADDVMCFINRIGIYSEQKVIRVNYPIIYAKGGSGYSIIYEKITLKDFCIKRNGVKIFDINIK